MKTQQEDDDVFDEHGVMRRDGTFRVPVQIMDRVQRAVADESLTARDEYIARTCNAWRQPPPPLPASTAASPKAVANDSASAYAAMVRDLGNAWRTP